MEIDNTSDTLDTGDILERIEHLRDLDDATPEHLEELSSLSKAFKNIDEEDLDNNILLINENHFEEYIEEHIKDTHDLSSIPDFISIHIDWEGIAKDMESNYSMIDFDGVTFYYQE